MPKAYRAQAHIGTRRSISGQLALYKPYQASWIFNFIELIWHARYRWNKAVYIVDGLVSIFDARCLCHYNVIMSRRHQRCVFPFLFSEILRNSRYAVPCNAPDKLSYKSQRLWENLRRTDNFFKKIKCNTRLRHLRVKIQYALTYMHNHAGWGLSSHLCICMCAEIR